MSSTQLRLICISVLLLISTVMIPSCSLIESYLDPWSGCPEDRQCLSGDIETREAKSCCDVDQICYSTEPTEGGTCMSKTEAAALEKKRTQDESSVKKEP